MNGDAEKLSAGAVYHHPSSSDSSSMTAVCTSSTDLQSQFSQITPQSSTSFIQAAAQYQQDCAASPSSSAGHRFGYIRATPAVVTVQGGGGGGGGVSRIAATSGSSINHTEFSENNLINSNELLLATMNGAMSASSSDGGGGGGGVGSVGVVTDISLPYVVAPIDMNNTTGSTDGMAVDGIAVPLDQLKQMLATQLEYYFSR